MQTHGQCSLLIRRGLRMTRAVGNTGVTRNLDCGPFSPVIATRHRSRSDGPRARASCPPPQRTQTREINVFFFLTVPHQNLVFHSSTATFRTNLLLKLYQQDPVLDPVCIFGKGQRHFNLDVHSSNCGSDSLRNFVHRCSPIVSLSFATFSAHALKNCLMNMFSEEKADYIHI